MAKVMVVDQKTKERRAATNAEISEINYLLSHGHTMRSADPKQAERDAYYKGLEKKYLNK